jgi:hypothetical protein
MAIGIEDFHDAMRRITQYAQAVVDRMGAGALQAPRGDHARGELRWSSSCAGYRERLY